MMDGRKSQQNAKKYVASFGKEVLSWYHLNDQILMLLEALLKCTLVGITISSYCASESERTGVQSGDKRLPNRCTAIDSILPLGVTSTDISIFDLFPDLYHRLHAQFLLEREDYCCQLKKIVNYLGDVAVAMQLTGNEVMSFIYNEQVAMWTDEEGAERVFGVDHMLDIIDLHGMFLCEYRRKQLIIQSLLKALEQSELVEQECEPAQGSGGVSGAAAVATRGESYVLLIRGAIAQWSTQQVNSNQSLLNSQDTDNSWCCIDNSRLVSFLETNGIKMD